MQDQTTPAEHRKPGRPPKSNAQRLLDTAENLQSVIAQLDDQDRFHIGRELNMRHGIMLAELTTAVDALMIVTRRRLNSV